MIKYNVDNNSEREALIQQTTLGILERKVPYGAIPNVPAASDFADQLVSPDDYKEVIRISHEEKIQPVYHQRASWAPPGVRWNQNGLNYCWAFGAAAAIMDKEARETGTVSLLAPTSLGWLVNWRNAGNYLASALKGVFERGICEAEYCLKEFGLGAKYFKDGWQENALLHRMTPGGIWDIDYTSAAKTIQHCITGLTRGFSIYIAYNWWGHALELVGVQWNESVPYNLEWWLRNSHNEDDIIIMTGQRAIISEGYIFRN